MEIELVTKPQITLVERGNLALVGTGVRRPLAKSRRVDQGGLQLGDEFLQRGGEPEPARRGGQDPELGA